MLEGHGGEKHIPFGSTSGCISEITFSVKFDFRFSALIS